MNARIGACTWIALCLIAAVPTRADRWSGRVSLEHRWWNQHEFAWRLAESAHLRWAIVDGISARGRAGGLDVPAAALAEQFEKATGIRLELLNGVVVGHRPNQARRAELEAKLSAGGAEAVRAAWLLGWLKDARAWPALAKAASGSDAAVGLSAAHALRRLDGEEDFDIRRWIPSGGERQGDAFYGKDSPLDAGLSQVPLGACFADPLTGEQLDALAASPYVPLREAAARITAGCSGGRAAAERLATDPSLLVRQAAGRSLRTWQASPPSPPRPVHRPNLAELWKTFSDNASGARSSASWLAAFGDDDDLRRLIEVRQADPDRARAVLEALMHKSGGPDVAELFRDYAAAGRPWPSTNQVYSGKAPFIGTGKYVLAMLFDGERLAAELGPRLGTEHWSLSSEFLLARFAGPPALPHFTEGILALRGHVAPLAVGYIGGPDAVRMIAPLLKSEDLSTAVAAARGLGESAQLAAVERLIEALSDPNRVLRSRAALALGRIGGPRAARALAELIAREEEYLPRRSAWAMLREIGAGQPEHAALLAAAGRELDAFVPSYSPVNPRLGPDLPEREPLDLGGIFSVVAIGEIRCAVDPYSGIWMFYGGCSGGYNNQAVAYDPAGGKWFLVRPPEMTGLFFNETRAGAGCSRGMAFDARSRKFWINNATRAPVGASSSNWAMYFAGGRACSYDLTVDRFEGPYPDPTGGGNRSGTWYVADPVRGHIYSEVMGRASETGASMHVIDTATGRLVERTFEGAAPGGLNAFYVHEAAGFDPVSRLLLREIRTHSFKRGRQPEEDFGLWLFDTAAGTVRKSRTPLPGDRPPNNPSGTQMIFDSLNRQLLCFRSTGAYVYDRDDDSWRKVADGERCYYVYDFDPQHNVFIGTGMGHNQRLVAFRLKNVPPGTKAHYGSGK